MVRYDDFGAGIESVVIIVPVNFKCNENEKFVCCNKNT